ncbi:T9SS type A sorting domain-containing protein [Sunxiuqinia indica]|uniref:T9SS type A sorting domain-containing protein n=1 Tax=Sunxiuqinia indica TaxID=2692584 RepID=UPI0013581F9E|nr:T9SS type A sorting domain-containing protein [Sunxiuqinia indica]
MNKYFSFLTIGILTALSVSSQSVDWYTKLEILQRTNHIGNNPVGGNSIADNFLLTEATQNEIQRLDSIIYYSYDESSEEWDINNFKISIFYDKHFSDTLIRQSRWDETTDSWLTLVEEIKKYNENRQLLNREFYIISRSGNRTEYTYNNDNDLIEVTESYLDAGEWRYKTRNVYSYNSENVLHADTLYQRFTISGTPVWHKTGITTFYYNTEGALMADTTVARYWIREHSFSEWELFGNTVIDNVVNKNTSETIIERWNRESNTFIPFKKEQTLFVDEHEDISASIDFKWNKELQLWDTTQMISYLYGNDDLIINYEKRTWGESPTKVFEVLDYDYTITNKELLLPISAINSTPAIAFHHKINSKQSFRNSLSTNEPQQFRETVFYYSAIESDLPTSLNNISNISAEIYPNPASQFIAINFPDSYHKVWLELFDLYGTKILSKAVNKSEKINISNLNCGLYIYSIWVDEQKTVGKLIIK